MEKCTRHAMLSNPNYAPSTDRVIVDRATTRAENRYAGAIPGHMIYLRTTFRFGIREIVFRTAPMEMRGDQAV